MVKRRLNITIGLFLLGGIILSLSCTGPYSQAVNPVSTEEMQLATSESALGSDEGEDQGSDTDQGNREFPPGYGESRIEYDHEFTFDMMFDGKGLRLEINVEDYVPINNVAAGYGNYWCNGENLTGWVYYKYKGEKQLQVNGTGLFSSGDESCSCEFSDKIDVSIEGITHSEKRNPGDQCDNMHISVAFDETWYSDPDWTCSCDDPDHNPIAEMNMEQIPGVVPPGLSEKTLRFDYICPGQFREENMISGIGKGVYQWTWRPGNDENKTDPMSTQQPIELDEDLFPDGPPSCVQVYEPQWGPALSSIDNGVTEWITD